MNAVGVNRLLSQGDTIRFGQLESKHLEAARSRVNLTAIDVDAANQTEYVIQRKNVRDGEDVSLNDNAVVLGTAVADSPTYTPKLWFAVPTSAYGSDSE
ncbi:hypothetical protein GL213_09955 [Halogeometricum borinquense]|uniref:Uncharacterized protein n=1 Tax=Halogeometricum borinquense (strain ATCC 700274 / DSM 11551 / JCM 10706 / KCTC 4070 / PR3) TaxID=469382 RepID=E4NP29_HALBP|nr:hypothetical protein [Halogeometricum borinquense]ADQ67570.1 hypothetical protein Hbor_20040 [Halogeometricum borinquense DSM 11551]ELY23750.1 hypothetical protein C499_18404 [Halogeometricum borinquense DSM 11551]QIQ76808.1 hypothetical protein GL213_09955 [Halogeometricum borinquense]